MNTQVWVRQDEIINKPDKANTFRQVKNLHAVLARLLCKIWHILQHLQSDAGQFLARILQFLLGSQVNAAL